MRKSEKHEDRRGQKYRRVGKKGEGESKREREREQRTEKGGIWRKNINMRDRKEREEEEGKACVFVRLSLHL